MKESKAIYVFCDFEEIKGMVWETELGLVVTVEGQLNLQNDLTIRSCETGEDVANIDLRNVLMDILPTKITNTDITVTVKENQDER